MPAEKPTKTHQHIGDLRCADCGESHGPIYMHGRCHPKAYTMCSVEGDLLRIECADCKSTICYFTLSGGPYSHPPLPEESSKDKTESPFMPG